MKSFLHIQGVVLLAWLAGYPSHCAAAPIQLRPPQVLQAAGQPLGTGDTYSIPCVTDWNGDGRKDLLVGFQPAGIVALFLNSGTAAQPLFTNVANIQYYDPTNGWQNVVHPSPGNCGAPSPWVCDYDGDGKLDLLVGDGKYGTVWFYRNTNPAANGAPILAPGVRLQVSGTNLTVSSRATPYVYDWDGDGLRDLLCGAGDGYVYYYRNTNSNTAPGQLPIYAPAVKIQAGGADLRLNQVQTNGILQTNVLDATPRSVVRVFDWDGDGLPDLICSSDTGVYWCRNVSTNSNPVLLAPVPLCAPTTNGLASIITGPVPGARMRLDLADWNNDGVMDLLLGNANGSVYYYEGYHFGFTRIGAQPGGQVVLEWNSAPNLKYSLWTTTCPTDSNCSPTFAGLPSGGNTTCWTNPVQGDVQFFRLQITP
jgi:hypothetical protein